MQSIHYLIFSALVITCTSTLAGQPPSASGMLFAHTMPQLKPHKNQPSISIAIPENIKNTQRQPSQNELQNVIIQMTPSAEPASFEQHQALRLKAWQAQQEQERRRQEQQELTLQREANRKQIIIVQQPARDPVVEGFLAIPRMLGYIFGSQGID